MSAALFLVAAAGLVAVASKPRRSRVQALRILRISRVVSDRERSQAFYRDALGFEIASDGEETLMRLGSVSVALVQFPAKGDPYPPESRSNDLWFQHLAIVVSDMDAAYAHLCRFAGWRPITEGGPQRLPPSNGAVRAFKFRDMDGHPLELIWFPDNPGNAQSPSKLFLTVDHSALSVSCTRRSLNFYRSLGFRVGERSLNRGLVQSSLDGLPNAEVQVTALQPSAETKPGLELLAYSPPGRRAATKFNDIAADWITIEVTTLFGEQYRRVQDPDGHRLLLIAQGSGLPA